MEEEKIEVKSGEADIPEEPKKEKGVSKKEFTALESKVNQGFDAILSKLEDLKTQAPVVAPAQPVKVEGGPDEQTLVPPAWKQLVREILGEDFDCELSLPESGGSIFRIIVPKDKSNATQMYWTMHKRDIRSKELGNTGAKGVKEWCLLVRRNLQTSGMKLPVYP
jgi:hypothetical protein